MPHCGQPPCRGGGALHRWMTRKISKIWRRGANQELTKPVRADMLHVTSAFVLVLALQPTTASQPFLTATQPPMAL